MNTKKNSVSVLQVNFDDKKLINKIFEIRNQVFVVEQNVDPSEEYEFEESSIHFLLFEEKTPCATARYRKTEKGIKLERFAVLKQYSKKGYGNTILKRILEELKNNEDVIYLHGAQEIAPELGLSDAIVDLVDSGNTLKENGLEEIKKIRDISTRLIANVACLKTKESLIDEYKSIIS